MQLLNLFLLTTKLQNILPKLYVRPTSNLNPMHLPSTPPPQAEAFEDFKKNAGSEIKKICDNNREVRLYSW